MTIRAGVVTVSDGCARGEREDVSGPTLARGLASAGFEIRAKTICPDDPTLVQQTLLRLCREQCDLIVTTGGTGFSPRDTTPEATLRVIEREAPGLAELLRWTGYQKTDRAVLSRGVAGMRGQTLIINLPGSPKAVQEGLEVLLPLLPHAIALMQDRPVDHTPMSSEIFSNADATQEFAQPEIVQNMEALQDSPPAEITLMETNLDDFSPEFFEIAMERLFAAGALDVYLSPIQMKKGRPATLLSIIAPPESAESIAEVLFTETSSFGIRYASMHRFTLQRTWEMVETDFGPIRIKIGRWKGVEKSGSPEYEEVKRAANEHNVPVKQVYAAAQSAYESFKAKRVERTD